MTKIKLLIGQLKQVKDEEKIRFDNIKFHKNPNLLKYDRIKIEPSTYDKTELR